MKFILKYKGSQPKGPNAMTALAGPGRPIRTPRTREFATREGMNKFIKNAENWPHWHGILEVCMIDDGGIKSHITNQYILM